MPRILERLLHWLSWRHHWRLLCIMVRAPVRAPSIPPPEGASFRVLQPGELRALAGEPAMDLRPAFVEEALGRGDTCVGAFHQGRVVGYAWIARSQAPDSEGVWVRVPAGLSYRYKAFLQPASRGHGIAPALYRYCDEVAGAAAISFIELHNHASLHASRRAGSARVGFAVTWRRPRRLWTWYSPGARRAGLRFFLPAQAGS